MFINLIKFVLMYILRKWLNNKENILIYNFFDEAHITMH